MIKKLPIDALEPGMRVVRLASDVWQHLPSLYTDPGPIESTEHLDRIKREGFEHAFVELPDPEQDMDRRLNDLLAAGEDDTPEVKERVPFEQAVEVAQTAYENAFAHTRRILNDAKLGRKVDYAASVKTIDAIVDSAISNPNTLLCLSKLMDFDDYTYGHCVNVSAISVIFGEFLGMDRRELTLLGVAGMLHDLGKVAVPTRIINKRATLTESEFDEIKRHPEYGYSMLMRQDEVHEEVLQAVRDHHEKFNGSGYPMAITNADIPPFARIISLADVYDALTSDRSYKNAILPNKALALMYGMRGQDFAPREIQKFIKCLGIYPAGSLVKLSTGDFAVVYESNPRLPLLPKIKIILDQNLRPIPSTTIDLAALQADGKEKPDILECADPSTYRVNLKPFLTRRR